VVKGLTLRARTSLHTLRVGAGRVPGDGGTRVGAGTDACPEHLATRTVHGAERHLTPEVHFYPGADALLGIGGHDGAHAVCQVLVAIAHVK